MSSLRPARGNVLKWLDWTAASGWRVALLVGGATLASTWFIQLVLLTWLLPEWSDGTGLLKAWDVGAFHSVAVDQAQRIAAEGWQAWTLRPNAWGVSGILSAWYALTVPAPWAFAPVQSLMYAVGLTGVFLLVRSVCGRPRDALIAVLPFLAAPSAATLYAQPHRDGFVFCALMLCLLGWWQLLRIQTQQRWSSMLGLAVLGYLLILAGFWLGWSVRRFAAELFQVISLAMLAVACIAAIAHRYRSTHSSHAGALILSVALVLMVSVSMLSVYQSRGFSGNTTLETDTDTSTAADSATEQSSTPKEAEATTASWSRSTWLPKSIDEKLRRVTGARHHMLTDYSHSRTLVDPDMLFTDANELLLYLPRAAQIGFLSPFPYQWIPDAEAPPFRNAQRVLMGVEMVFVYALLPFLVAAVWVWRGRPALWVLVCPAVIWVMAYATTVPVVGALVRYRYAAMILLLPLAVVGLLATLRRNRSGTVTSEGRPADAGPGRQQGSTS